MIHPNKKVWNDFTTFCTKIESPKEFMDLFDLILTHEEKDALASRYLIIKSLLEGEMTQREISEKFKVSIAQITRGSNALKLTTAKFRENLKSKI